MRSWLVAIREDRKMTQKVVAEKVGITQPTYSNLEKGSRSPGVAVAKRVADVLGFDWTKFYEEGG